MYLQMKHEWFWLESVQEYQSDTDLSNYCRSLISTWNSSLGLDVGNWRKTEELEESSPRREPSELLVGDEGSEEYQDEAEQVNRQNLLHFLSEGEESQESKEEDQGEGYGSEMEESPLGECEDGCSLQGSPLVDILLSHTASSNLPMDLTSVKRNLSKGRIRTLAQFQRDLMLMFQNAVMYNDSDHHVYHMAVEMQREVLEQIQVLNIWLDQRRDLSSLE
ncbi:bromodomain-containing protein 8-like isoform X4 [Ochotona curzoniae]|uniref:bromodomain-containing protein 8-like isoform X4 n=1 Tax=Ochotona curzoniae TaxID=130825 RepID=UPI001B34FF54|nr:bromodomain-containing protein 8-like isoform X4 [Ochotona curzoniae]